MPRHGKMIPDQRMDGKGYRVSVSMDLPANELEFLLDRTKGRGISRAAYIRNLIRIEMVRAGIPLTYEGDEGPGYFK